MSAKPSADMPLWDLKLQMHDEEERLVEYRTRARMSRAALQPWADQTAARNSCRIVTFSKYMVGPGAQNPPAQPEVVRTTPTWEDERKARMAWMDKLAGVDTDIGTVEEIKA